jgi:uncharacterized membrane protein
MSASWFYSRDNQPQGPVSEEDFRTLVGTGVINETTLIWREGLTNWAALRHVPDAPRPLAPQGEGTSQVGACALCGRVSPVDELITLAGRPICAVCKPVALQRLEEGVGLPSRTHIRSIPVDATALIDEVRARGYEVNIGSLLSRAWSLYKANFWECFAVSTVVLLLSQIIGLIPFVGAVLSILLQGPLLAGLFLFFLRVVRSQPARVSDVFDGFNPEFWRYLLTSLVVIIPTVLVMILFTIPIALVFGYTAFMGGANQGPDMLLPSLVMIPLILLGILMGIYLQIALSYAIPLAADLQLGPIDAALTSFRAVNLRVGWVLLLALVIGLILVAGLLALLVGFLFALPIYWLTMMLLYEEIFAPRDPAGIETAPQPAPGL